MVAQVEIAHGGQKWLREKSNIIFQEYYLSFSKKISN